MDPGKTQSALAGALFVIYLLFLVGLILFKLPFYSPATDERVVNLIPLMGSFDERGVFVLREIVYNVLLFVPLGVYISMLRPSWRFRKKIVVIVGLTLAFEVSQFIFALGISDVTDILSNTLGGVIGIGVYALLLRLFKGRAVKIVNAIALVVIVCATIQFAHLLYLSHFVMTHPTNSSPSDSA
jgi:glycopeptide antibiotics resistance protein